MFSVFKLRCMGIYCYADVSSMTMALNSYYIKNLLLSDLFRGICKKQTKKNCFVLLTIVTI